MGAQEGPVEPPRIGGSAGWEEAQDYVVRGQSCEVIGGSTVFQLSNGLAYFRVPIQNNKEIPVELTQ